MTHAFIRYTILYYTSTAKAHKKPNEEKYCCSHTVYGH